MELFKQKNSSNLQISHQEFRRLGLTKDYQNITNTIEELKQNTPNIVIADCNKNMTYQSNGVDTYDNLLKNRSYVMSMGLYLMLYMNGNDRILKPAFKKFKDIYKPYNGEDLNNKTLLISRAGGIGDLLFILPNIIYLKEKYPTSKIIIACSYRYHSMIENWDCVDEILPIPTDVVNYRRSHYHAIFEGVIIRCKEAEKENAYRLFSRMMNLNLSDDLLIPKQPPIINDDVENFIKTKQIKKPFILFQMRASSPIRTPRPKIFKTIIDELTKDDINIVLTDSKNNKSDLNDFISTLKHPTRVFNFSEYSNQITETISLTSHAKMVVTVDSALAHIAASLDIPIFGIYGPFLGSLRLSTYKNCEWYDCEAKCAPCFKHGYQICKNNKNEYSVCFDNIDYDYVIDKIKEIYNK